MDWAAVMAAPREIRIERLPLAAPRGGAKSACA